MRKKLGVNIDHVATVREARKVDYPDPLYAATLAELAGADGITIHLRQDRRHIQDRDVYLLRNSIKTGLNLEMSLNAEILDIALKVIPDEVCFVPELREEVTTEGGLDVVSNLDKLKGFTQELRDKGIVVSLFIAPENKQIEAAKESGAEIIEIHTGAYANAVTHAEQKKELASIINAAEFAASIGLRVNAGHGLNYLNTYPIALIEELEVLNIGHSIISRAVFVGIDRAVRDMLDILDRANIDGLSG